MGPHPERFLSAPPAGPGPPDPPHPAAPPPPGPVRRVLRWLLPLLGLALLAAVLVRIPWRDRLLLADGRILSGRILGEAGGGGVRFEPAGDGEARTFGRGELAEREKGLPAAEEGVVTLAGRLRAGTAILALALTAMLTLLAAGRWRLLLAAQEIPVPLTETASLTFMGNFLNQVVPGGIVGGDVLKGVYAARGKEKRAGAFVSVFVDRVSGLFGTVILAAGALIPWLEDPRFRGAAILSYGLLVAGGFGVALVLSRRMRRLLRTDRWLERVPLAGAFLAEADRAVLLYRSRRGAVAASVGLSVLIHAGWCFVNAQLGAMLGIDLDLAAYFAVVPAILVVSAIPLLPGGWGIGEAAFVLFLSTQGVPPAEAVSLSILGRTILMAVNLPGGFVFLARRV